MAIQGYSGPYGNMYPSYLPTNGALQFVLGVSGQYLTVLTRRGVAAYSNLTSVQGAGLPASSRLTAPGATAAPARIGPMCAFFPNRAGAPATLATSPY